jgi:hypothetical protein
MPLLRESSRPPFEFVGQCVEFMGQLLEVHIISSLTQLRH